MTFYKVRHRETGLFSTGGYDPRWCARGKTWGAIGHVKCHLKQFKDGYCAKAHPDYLASVEIVEYTAAVEAAGERVIPFV